MTRGRLALADGRIFEGEAFGASNTVTGEVVFNTSLFGYQEILTDPSYVGQIVTMSTPHIGNVGANASDEESDQPHATGLLVRDHARPSNWRSQGPLDHYLARHRLFGLSGLDTRAVVRHVRTHGAQLAALSVETVTNKALVDYARGARTMEGRDLATALSTKVPYLWSEGTPDVLAGKSATPPKTRFRVVAIDYGLKRAMLRALVDVGCEVTVVPCSSSSDSILARKPDGVFLTNGPGDPAAVIGAQETVAALLGKVPVFGICLGHQILALALGARTYKMKFGHRGANQPVKELATGRVEITSQNHGFAVDATSLAGRATVSHLNLNDGTVEGLEARDARAFSVQHHPEASPGPHDSRHLFARFAAMMEGRAW